MAIIKCKNCKREVEHHAKGMCTTCYKKLAWEAKKVMCKRCGRMLPMHAKGYCTGCYTLLFHYDKIREYNSRKEHNIDLETYKKLTEKCIICGFDKVVDLHHLDGKHENNSENNLIGLCPNHHKMLHTYEFKDEIFKILKEKGFST